MRWLRRRRNAGRLQRRVRVAARPRHQPRSEAPVHAVTGLPVSITPIRSPPRLASLTSQQVVESVAVFTTRVLWQHSRRGGEVLCGWRGCFRHAKDAQPKTTHQTSARDSGKEAACPGESQLLVKKGDNDGFTKVPSGLKLGYVAYAGKRHSGELSTAGGSGHGRQAARQPSFSAKHAGGKSAEHGGRR